MNEDEKLLVELLRLNEADKNAQAYVLQAYIQKHGSVSAECAAQVNMLLGEPLKDSRQQS